MTERVRHRPTAEAVDDRRVQDFQQAKNTDGTPQFLPIAAKPKPKAARKLTRVAFRVSRLMEFCTQRELGRVLIKVAVRDAVLE
jgi:hypothetical protein